MTDCGGRRSTDPFRRRQRRDEGSGMSDELHRLATALEENIATVVLGKRDVVRLCVVALLAGEHILIEDVPGVGKTLIGKSFKTFQRF